MKALVLEAYKKFAVKEVPTPLPGPGEVQLRIMAVAICGSDVHGYDGASGRREPPLIPGHEASGVVSLVGERVTKYKPGDRVVFNSVRYCRDCYYCRRGQLSLCSDGCCYGVRTGSAHLEGAMCEYLCVPEYIVYPMPEGISFPQAALIEPLSIACHAVGGLSLGIQDTGLVCGAGVIGLMVLKVLRAAGCRRVLVAELDETKKELARRNGAEAVLDGREDIPARVRALTGGLGADFAVEAVGVTATISSALGSLKKGGTLIQVGNVSPKAEIPLQLLVTNELKIAGRYGTSTEYETALSLVASGAVSIDDCISAVAPLEEGQKWFDNLHDPKTVAREGLVKVVLTP